MLLDGERWDLVSMPGAASESITRGVISAPPCSEPSLDAPHGYALLFHAVFLPLHCLFSAFSPTYYHLFSSSSKSVLFWGVPLNL